MITVKRGRRRQCLRAAVRWVTILCAAGLAVSCAAPIEPPKPTPVPTEIPALPLAVLRIEVMPTGAAVYVNDEAMGQTPLSMHLPGGSYTLRVEQEGYCPLHREVTLSPGEEVLMAESLPDLAPPVLSLNQVPDVVQAGQIVSIRAQAMDNEAVRLIRLLLDGQVIAEQESNQLDYGWDTASAAAGMHQLALEASDDQGNVGRLDAAVRVTKPETPVSTPTQPMSSASSDLIAYETTLTLSAYPYAAYLKERVDPQYNTKVVWLDRDAYEASHPQPQPRTFLAIVLENRYLRLTFLPKLGGRLYRCMFKPSGQNIFYQNSVLKPSYWGPLPRDENWWLAAGGMEWALPVQEHGYEWGIPWTYRIERRNDRVSVVLYDSTADDRLRAEIRVSLVAGRAYFVVEPRLVNPTSQAVSCQFWLNAALTLGSPTVSTNTEFIYPTAQMIVHSTGDSALPGERQVMSWPEFDGRDLSRYGNWRNWLGVFVAEVQQSYAGAYNHETKLGIVRLAPSEVAKGLKLFGFGAEFAARSEYCDDGSAYFEMWGGPCRSFWPQDDYLLPASGELSWREVWLPFAEIGGFDQANEEVVSRASARVAEVQLGLAVSAARRLQVVLGWNGQTFHQLSADLAPEAPLLTVIPMPGEATSPGKLAVQVLDSSGATLLQYEKPVAW